MWFTAKAENSICLVTEESKSPKECPVCFLLSSVAGSLGYLINVEKYQYEIILQKIAIYPEFIGIFVVENNLNVVLSMDLLFEGISGKTGIRQADHQKCRKSIWRIYRQFTNYLGGKKGLLFLS